jgi:Predicted transcriptional regulators
MAKTKSFFKTEMLFLKILEEKDCYGYEITHSIKERTNGEIDIKEGSMYPILYRLEELGYISSRKETVGKRMTRIYYHLEPTGKTHLHKIYLEFQEMINTIIDLMEDENNE